mmetsp:Transcript_26013/g.39377  ORF Transcript_26013/g.39377 Transcript_26013/m.39377 type:complete len:176 (+) Transcript_26013:157-684(+)|eukprot:CAMPEP_0178899554 /NCGR_PEP_ID=MMETSP0786-20121207/2968_1 /TAXON_ID=186022 /ORGANISM="Thalassionema frauenfeldii, Strain CCMP 1798" /LENGTH=175 /DNA_ID=CAMNT_0020570431 /DNA_START=72 /DNA_END=599 /DNA_ORIENTATION=-
MVKGDLEMVTDGGHPVPDEKKWMPSTRDNSVDKWRTVRGKHKDDPPTDTIGALEVQSEPFLNVEGTYSPMMGSEEDDDLWKKAQDAWDAEGLRSELITATAGLPVKMRCCGLIRDEDQRIKDMVPYLNKHFVPAANEKLKEHGFKIDAFLWLIHNLQGKSETLILLIRFFEIIKA